MEKAGGGSIVTMTYLGGERAVPHYNVMGVAKATLDASVKYLAWDLGEKNIRVNAISAGPVRTLAARSIAGFPTMEAIVEERAPLHRHVDAEDVGARGRVPARRRREERDRDDAVRRQRVPRDGHVDGRREDAEETPAAKADHETPAAAEISATWTGGARADRLHGARELARPAQGREAGCGDLLRLVRRRRRRREPSGDVRLQRWSGCVVGISAPRRRRPAARRLPGGRHDPGAAAAARAERGVLARVRRPRVRRSGRNGIQPRSSTRTRRTARRRTTARRATPPTHRSTSASKRDLESLCEFMSGWLSSDGPWGSPIFIAGESYGGYRVGRLVRMLQETTGIGLNGAILISPALESRR